MPFTEPTLAQIDSRADAAIVSRLPTSSPALPIGIIPGIKRALDGAVKMLVGFLNNLYVQATPWGATGASALSWATLWSVTPAAPSAASGSGTATGENDSDIPSGSTLQDGLGNTYTTTADATIASGTATISLLASVAGSAGNQESGATLTFLNAPEGVNATVTLTNGLAGGADLQTWQQVKQRMLNRIQTPPQGGSQNDYVTWAFAANAGITRAWCFPLYSGLGTVRVYVADDSYSGTYMATSDEVMAIQTYIDSVKPAGTAIIVDDAVVSGVTVIAPAKSAVDFSISGIPENLQGAVTASLQALFFAAVPESSVGLQSMIIAIGEAAGTGVFTLTAPTTDQTAAAGHLLTLGTVSFS